jgi:deoxycytidylate deaminase
MRDATYLKFQSVAVTGFAFTHSTSASYLPFRSQIHAEVRAISQCARIGQSVAGATIYVTLAPCVDCFLAIVASGA